MKVLQRNEKKSNKGEVMWSVMLDNNKVYDAYKYAEEYELRSKGAYVWAVPMATTASPIGTNAGTQETRDARNISIERQNACRHAAAVVAAFIGTHPAISTKDVDALVRHYYNLWHDIITGKEGGELG